MHDIINSAAAIVTAIGTFGLFLATLAIVRRKRDELD